MSGEYTRALQDIYAKLDSLVLLEKLLVQERAANAKHRVTIARFESELRDARALIVSGQQRQQIADLKDKAPNR